MKVPLKLV